MTSLVEQFHALEEQEQIEFFQSAVEGLTVKGVLNLVKALEKAWDVEATPNFGAPPVDKEEEEVEQTSFSVVITGYAQKLPVIRLVRTIINKSLKETKTHIEALPSTIQADLPREEADKLKVQLEEAGATVEIK